MAEPFPVKGVANAFLRRSFDDQQLVTHMKLQKLVYLAHGYHLAKTGNPLVCEGFEAWPYGPVSSELYNEFKCFKGAPINQEATEIEVSCGDDEDTYVEVPVPVRAADHDPDVKKVIDFVWKVYGSWKATELSDLTHKPGWAWEKARKINRTSQISNDDIKKDFLPFIKTK
ncbi:Panacea domain-containing protein [Komagataeibacter oboediens]|uniref:Panacea domain-containing protein n=1 Tax=Komagataeibacter oboediens TaxID=65958 RepID=UPI001C2D18CB|nr:type II toxin-antitoxin system antitoxin SocA domain-containing protein [Komagataeibacter oboediens]MBV1825742.1 DUF4065 domain-containing protein [Komagataeibacter oboediens]